MTKPLAPDWPRMMRKAVAAAYCDLHITQFEKEVAAGRLPSPSRLGGADRWSRSQIDEALERIIGTHLPDWREQQPLYTGQADAPH